MKHTTAALLTVLFAGCSSSGIGDAFDTTGSETLTTSQANALAEQIGAAFSNGVTSASTSSALMSSIEGPTAYGVTINQQFSRRTTCTAGGAMEVTGSLTGSLNNSGSGLLLLQVNQTITDWRCIQGFVLNGDPYLTVTGQMSFSNGRMSSAATFRFGGGIKWGTSASESIQVNMTATVNPNGTGSISGTIGGTNVVASY